MHRIVGLTLVILIALFASCAKDDPATLTVSPARVSLVLGQGQQFTASESGVDWAIQVFNPEALHAGRISSSGYYTAPSPTELAFEDSVTVVATKDSRRATAIVALRRSTSSVTVTVSPDSASVALGATQQFSATVTGTTNTGFTWRVDGVPGGNTTSGTISSGGLYQAPATMPGSDRHIITAVSVEDTNAVGNAVVRLVSGTNPGAGVLIKIFEDSILVAAQDMAAQGNFLYVAEGSGRDTRFKGVRVLSVSDPTHPVEVGQLVMTGYPVGIAVKGERAYVTILDNGNKLKVLDISSTTPSVIRTMDLPNQPRKAVISGDYLYLTASTAGFVIYDISSPNAEELAGIYAPITFGANAMGIAVYDSVLVLALEQQGLEFWNVSDRHNPTSFTHIASYYAQDVVIQGPAVYLADGVFPASSIGSLFIYNAGDPQNPYAVLSDSVAGSCRRVTGNSRYAYYLDDHGGMTVYNTWDLSHPEMVHQVEITGVSGIARFGQALTMSGHVIFAAYMGRLIVYRHDW